MLKDLTLEQEKMAEFMSSISERCYYAAWIKNLEYVLWDAVNSGQRNYGHGIITDRDIRTLKTLADKSESWIIFHDDFEETALDLNT
jgi:hypothetical protein